MIMKKIYAPNPVHRQPSSGHSQWEISEQDEISCFVNSESSGWIGNERGWGLHDVRETIVYLGTDRETDERTFHAKFIDNAASGVWHGFPASRKDRPDESILKDWLIKGLVRTKAIKQLSKGMKCSL